MIDKTGIHVAAPDQLITVREMTHRAVQHLSRAARANLAANPDDSHSNLSWTESRIGFLSQPIIEDGVTYELGFSMTDFEIFMLRDGQQDSAIGLWGKSDDEVAVWLDDRLTTLQLQPAATVPLPYELPEGVAHIDRYVVTGQEGQVQALAAWYRLSAEILSNVVLSSQHIKPGPSPVRCWPHHFDIATYIALEEGDFEIARGIGVGMSPGDETYGEPYFYINPWPHLDPANLPPLPDGGHWHTEGFVGAIATASELQALTDVEAGLSTFIQGAVEIGRTELGC